MITSLLLFFFYFYIQGCAAIYVEVTPREVVTLPKQNVTFLCKVGIPIQYCRIEIPGLHPFNLNPNLPASNGVVYFGSGLQAGQCGATIDSIHENNNGVVRCSMGTATEVRESSGTMALTVAKAPKTPELDLSRGTDSVEVYRVNDYLQGSCIVRDGRPAANISWFLDDEPIYDDLGMVTIVDDVKEDLFSVVQNFTRRLRASDNGKKLRCVAVHPALSTHNNEVSRQLDIKYPPLPAEQTPVELYEFELGKPGIISVDIHANPRPKLEWIVSDEHIREGSTDSTARLEAQIVRDEGRGHYIATLRLASITKQDIETQFRLSAYNDQGSTDYYIVIHTTPQPEGLELGIGYIVGIVVAILLVLIAVFLVVFARATGRWCFSGTTIRHVGETSSDTESTAAVEHQQHHRQLKFKAPNLNKLGNVFKRNKDKVAHEETSKPMELLQEESSKTEEKPAEGIVYAELDLVAQNLRPLVKSEDDKTEYAEIIYTPKTASTADEDESTAATVVPAAAVEVKKTPEESQSTVVKIT